MAAAGLVLAAADGGLAWETDTNRIGATYSTIPLDDPGSAAESCAALCVKDAQCRAWTLVKEGNPDLGAGTFSLCLLKNAVPAAVFDECCISGVAAGVEATEPSQVNESDEAPVRPDAQSAATMPEGPVTVEMSPEVVPVGKWPEGIAHDGSGLWLAMSGERQLYRTDPETGEIVRRVKVGRLPVRLAAFGDGPVYATVATDKIIWAQPSEGKGRAIARLKDYPQSLATDGESVWALTWVNGSSSQTRVERIDPAGGETTRSDILPRNGFDVTVSGDTVWTLHRLDGENRSMVVGLNKDTLAEEISEEIDGFLMLLTAGEHGNYAAGGQSTSGGLIVRLDPQTGVETARHEGAAPFAAVTTGFDYVIAADGNGSVSVLTGDDLTLVQTINLTTGPVRPQAILVWGDQLFMTTHSGTEDAGSLIIVNGWRP
ncbi:PAN domain-containing protein [Zhengella sp. ZM62]|uniref:PAN domain-containing protein n=1 Tax=Zhengella sedimenti TaxID=3390035 RepID=UPI003976FE13